MKPEDIDFAFSLTSGEGWLTETKECFRAFLDRDPEGAFVAEKDGERIGICIGVAYADFGFLGELIVLPGYRGAGYGRALFGHTLNFFEKKGIPSVVLHGDLEAVPIYERAGFMKICRSLNFLGTAEKMCWDGAVRDMKAADMDRVLQLDGEAFGADRSVFLKSYFKLSPHLCFVEEDENGNVNAFIMGREGNGVVAGGPWVMNELARRPQDLLKAFSTRVHPGRMRIDVLETQEKALKMIAREFPFLMDRGYSWKMIRGEYRTWGRESMALAIGSPATG